MSRKKRKETLQIPDGHLVASFDDGTTYTEIPPAMLGSDEITTATANSEAVKRHRRSPLELFAAKKQERADAVAAAELAVKRAESDLADAIEAHESFLKEARAALGL